MKINISLSKVLHEDMKHLDINRLNDRQQYLVNYLIKNRVPFDVEEGGYDEPFHVVLHKKGNKSTILQNDIEGGWIIYKVYGHKSTEVARDAILKSSFIELAINV